MELYTQGHPSADMWNLKFGFQTPPLHKRMFAIICFSCRWLKSHSRYNRSANLWMMRHTRNNDFLALSRASESSLLLGTHLWEVYNDSSKCTREGKDTYLVNLTLHACSTENFACDNAFCIPMENRCDGVEHCRDGSDERDWRKLIMRKGYKKELNQKMAKMSR